VEKKYVAGDAVANAAVLKTYNYIPSVSGAYEAFGILTHELQAVGMLDASVDVEALHTNSFAFFDDVPDTVTGSETENPAIHNMAAMQTEDDGKVIAEDMVTHGDCCP
jgi:hypothetical protein